MKTKITKRIFAVLLTMVMLLSAVPISAFAVNEQDNSSVETETYAKGVNSVGNVLAGTIEEAQAEAEEKATANAGISLLEFDNLTANVKFTTDRNAKLVVAVYTEDGKKMLASAVENVTAEETEATVELDNVTLPQYYLVKAFLLDSSNNSALCDAISNDTHTQAYIDFMKYDVNDFDDEKVINLDENEDSNFLVVTDEADVINGSETTNSLKSADYENNEYVFENIDGKIKNLKVGDIFYYENGEDFEIIKVKSIKINGSTATIVADEIDIEEAFDFIKIDTADYYDETEQARKSAPARAKGTDIDKSVKFFKSEFELEFKKNKKGKIYTEVTKKKLFGQGALDLSDEILEEDENGGDLSAKFNWDGYLGADVKVFLSGKYKSIEVNIGVEASVSLTFAAEFSYNVRLGKAGIRLWGLLYVGCEIRFKFEASAKLEISGTFTFKGGFKVDNNKNFEKIKEGPKFEPVVKVEGEIYIGIMIGPFIDVIHEKLLEIQLPIDAGFKLTATLFSTDDMFDEKHDCTLCLSGSINAEIKASATVKIGGKSVPWIYHKGEFEILTITIPIGDFYYSITHNKFGMGTCPYIKADDDPNTGEGGLTGGEKVGDIIEFGSYPQSRVTNDVLIDGLNGQSFAWRSYGYYSGNGSYGSMKQSKLMEYADVVFNGNKYRAVKINDYRPYVTGYTSSANNTYQDDNGYQKGSVYWFKYEPIKWRVLNPEAGYVLCETCIDSQAYSNTIYQYGTDPNGYTAYYNDEAHTNYANDWVTSSIREWLNNDFYNTAFTSTQKGQIAKRTINNGSPYNSTYSSASTTDKVWLLSYEEATNSAYGFATNSITSDIARQAKSTDYAKAQGCYKYSGGSYDGNAYWILRSPGSNSDDACLVYYGGSVYSGCSVDYATLGVRPALKLNLTSKISTSSVESENFVVDEPQEVAVPKKAITRAAAAAETGSKISISGCAAGNDYVFLVITDYVKGVEITSDNLQYIDLIEADENGKLAIVYAPKTESDNNKLLLVGDFGNGIQTKVLTKKCEHTFGEWKVVTPATTEKEGLEERICSKCGAKETRAIPKLIPEKILSVKLNNNSVETNYNRSFTLTPNVEVVGNLDYTVEYTSSNPSVAVVYDDGEVITTGKGNATITVTVTDSDGNVFTDTCNVNVKFNFGQWLLYIICFGWIWM